MIDFIYPSNFNTSNSSDVLLHSKLIFGLDFIE